MSRIIVIISVLVLSFLLFYCNNHITSNAIAGQYINKNYRYPALLPDIPYENDTLVLLKNNTFSSSYYGEGSYFLSYSNLNTYIIFQYECSVDSFLYIDLPTDTAINKNKAMQASFKAEVIRTMFGKPKIILNKDQNHYYEKLVRAI